MSLDFLLHYGGRRLRQYVEQPLLATSADEDEAEEKPQVDLQIEKQSLDAWEPLSVDSAPLDPAARPQRFIDGCHYGETVAWLQDAVSHPIPVRLAEIGGVCMRIDGRSLHREFVHVERLVCFSIDPFPWHEVEGFATALTEQMGIRLVAARLPKIDEERRELTYDFELMRQQTRLQAQEEMRTLEELALRQDVETLSLVDGRIGPHRNVIGVIKQHRESYLHPQGWQVFYGLRPGQRTPAFKLMSQNQWVVSWYLKLDGAQGAMPNWGVVRVEISYDHFKRQASDFGYLDRLSNALMHLRCRQNSYARAPVSMEPIVRAEESLKSLLTRPATLAQRFYHLTGL